LSDRLTTADLIEIAMAKSQAHCWQSPNEAASASPSPTP
jgi:hypothetical protein